MGGRSELQSFLYRQHEHYRTVLERMFGRFDSAFFVSSIKGPRNEVDCPEVYFPDRYRRDGACRVEIRISADPWRHCLRGQAAWQVAHETVHLLNPVELGHAAVLEEGLATWFQDEPEFHDDVVKQFIAAGKAIHTPAYEEARDLVRECMPGIIPAVRRIRGSGSRLSEITADQLRPFLPGVSGNAIERICRKF